MPVNWSQMWTPTSSKSTSNAATPATPSYSPKMVGGINEQMQSGQARTQYDAGKALRQYQMDSAKSALARNLSAIDRAQLDTYKNLGNSYAARGMIRSGGYLSAQDQATANLNEQRLNATQSVSELEQQNQLADIQALAGLQGIDYNILQQYIAALMAGKINKTGQV
jgi:hypothetical protein